MEAAVQPRSSGLGLMRQSTVDQLCPHDLLPKQPQQGYETEPSWPELMRKTLEELRTLPEFKVSNEHGSIKFYKMSNSRGIDITQVDLALSVKIDAKSVAVYEDLGGFDKPAVGEKINVPSKVTLFKVPPRKD